jgi:hypothetical protein
MKIGILGGSNAIMKSGWSPVFFNQRPQDEITNFSAGGSGTALGLYRLCSSPGIANLDVAIVEYCVSDHWLLEQGIMDEERLNTYVFNLLAGLVLQGVMPIVVIIPVLPAIVRGSEVRDIWLRQASALNVPVIDVHLLFQRISKSTGIPYGSFFPRDDGSHSKQYAQRLIGLYTSLALDRICSEKDAWQIRLPQNYRFPFYSSVLKDHFPELVVQRKTSLMEVSLVRFEPGSAYKVECSDKLHGIFANRSQAAGICRLVWGEKEVVKNLRHSPGGQSWNLNMEFVTLRDTPSMETPGFAFFEAADHTCRVTEPTASSSNPAEPCAIEIEGLLLSNQLVPKGEELCEELYRNLQTESVIVSADYIAIAEIASFVINELVCDLNDSEGSKYPTIDSGVINLVEKFFPRKGGSIQFTQNLAVHFLLYGHPAQALTLLEIALRDYPKGPWLHFYACQALLAQGNISRAQVHLDWLTEPNEIPPSKLKFLQELFDKTVNSETEIKRRPAIDSGVLNFIEKIAQQKSDSIGFIRDLAVYFLVSGHPAQALTLLETALRDRPVGPWLHFYACQALLAQGNMSRAQVHLDWLTEANEIPPLKLKSLQELFDKAVNGETVLDILH